MYSVGSVFSIIYFSPNRRKSTMNNITKSGSDVLSLSPHVRGRKGSFWEELAVELDIFDTALNAPSWVYSRREELLSRMTSEEKRICRWLKALGLTFKIKWPISIGDKWKYADVYFPRQRTVLIVTNAMAVRGRPHWMLSDRAEFFAKHFRVIEIETLAELERKMALKKAEKRQKDVE